ncbi:MAG: flagellar basal body-associated FliL family protein, partial [Thermodesulfobacteriota bacterium]|nr:flagellar basal body-associated FliL family protein [Thermodesulfobacteriota bacterium]
VEEVEKWLSKIRDTILTILPNRKFEDIKSVEGKKVLRDEIIAKLNNFLGEGTIVNIYYTEFIVQ